MSATIPDRKSKITEELTIDGTRKNVRVERWHYKAGKNALTRIVVISSGKVVAIETGRR